jgi:hypothetical protein
MRAPYSTVDSPRLKYSTGRCRTWGWEQMRSRAFIRLRGSAASRGARVDQCQRATEDLRALPAAPLLEVPVVQHGLGQDDCLEPWGVRELLLSRLRLTAQTAGRWRRIDEVP